MNAYLALLLGIAATSGASIFVRLADAPALVIAAARLGLASLVLLPVAAARGGGAQVRALPGRMLGWALLSGLMLAIHFATWVASLKYTSVASSEVIVNTSPVWVALASVVFLRERLRRLSIAGITLAVAGGVVIGGGDLNLGSGALFGDFLALLGAWSVSVYFLAGRRLRAHLSLAPYVATIYAVAALALLAVVLMAGLPLGGYSSQTYLMFALMAGVPQLMGHTAYNFALRDLSATLVSVATLMEPIGATILAALMLGEAPSVAVLAGGAVVIGGIVLVTAGERP